MLVGAARGCGDCGRCEGLWGVWALQRCAQVVCRGGVRSAPSMCGCAEVGESLGRLLVPCGNPGGERSMVGHVLQAPARLCNPPSLPSRGHG